MLILRNDLAGSSSGFFDRNWTDYRQGFGNRTTLYWIGLDRLHNVSQGNCQARIDLQATNGSWYYAQYSNFSVGDSSTNYTLTIGGYSGDTGYDAMAAHNGQQFTTKDADHDLSNSNCASLYGGGFWYAGCGRAHLTTSRRTNTFSFEWYYISLGSKGWMQLNFVEVRLLC